MTLEDKIVNAVNTYLASFGKKDLEGILNLFADDAWVEDPVGTPRKVGKAALREFYQIGTSMDLTAALESDIRVAGNEAAFAFCVSVNTGNGTLKISPIDIMTFNDEGKITSMRAFFGPRNQKMA
jgi:steroid delta-isomerase